MSLPLKIKADLDRFNAAETSLIEQAYLFAQQKHKGQKRLSGSTTSHLVRVAHDLIKDNYDLETIIAGFLHDSIEEAETTYEEIAAKFGEHVAKIVDGVTRVSSLKMRNKSRIFNGNNAFLEQVDNYRKVLFAAITDPRVIVVKLYDRLDNVRTIKWLPKEKIKFYARETIEIFAPIADRLGMGVVKSKLEDLAFPYAYPEEFKNFRAMIRGFYENDEIHHLVMPEIRRELEKSGVTVVSISGRTKGMYSLYKKLQRKGTISTIYDIVAMRIIVKTIEECYRTLGVVHTLYEPIPGEIDDYIAKPKENGYRSLHTTVRDKSGNIFEIQIRTEKMHEQSERGSGVAHWNYKEKAQGSGSGNDEDWAKELEKLRSITNNKQFLTELKENLFAEQIFAFTPSGDIIKLPVGSTPVDFAYRIHSGLGERTSGAKVNNRIVPLSTELRTSDVVEIIAGKAPNPSRDWLRFVKTSQAKQHIRAYMREQHEDSFFDRGSLIIAELIAQNNLAPLSKQKAEEILNDSRLPYNTQRAALVAIGEGALKPQRLLKLLYPKYQSAAEKKLVPSKRAATNGIPHLKNIRHEFAKCCKPLPTDAIVGYVSRDHVIKIHRADCKRLPQNDKSRIIELK